jgi:hypothetical protein
MGNWRYTYAAHRKYGIPSGKSALDILNDARGEITREEFAGMKSDISKTA